METFETFSTTADVGIRIRGKGYEGLFQSAVKGLNFLYFGTLPEPPQSVGPPQTHPFRFRGDSGENILVNLLSEVVFLLQNEARVTVEVKVHRADDTYIESDLLTVPLHIEPELEIKSVTYHNLSIKDERGIKSAEVVFDI
jgi:SHS2 domain-containing protein